MQDLDGTSIRPSGVHGSQPGDLVLDGQSAALVLLAALHDHRTLLYGFMAHAEGAVVSPYHPYKGIPVPPDLIVDDTVNDEPVADISHHLNQHVMGGLSRVAPEVQKGVACGIQARSAAHPRRHFLPIHRILERETFDGPYSVLGDINHRHRVIVGIRMRVAASPGRHRVRIVNHDIQARMGEQRRPVKIGLRVFQVEILLRVSVLVDHRIGLMIDYDMPLNLGSFSTPRVERISGKLGWYPRRMFVEEIPHHDRAAGPIRESSTALVGNFSFQSSEFRAGGNSALCATILPSLT